MNIEEVKKKIRGPMIPVITSLNKDLSIDVSAIRNEVEYLIGHSNVALKFDWSRICLNR